MKIEQKIIVNDDMYNTFPSITRMKNDHLIMVYRQAKNRLKEYGRISHVDPSSKVMMKTSDDEGETWSESRVVYNDEMGEQDPCINCLVDGTLICTFFRWKIVPKEEKASLGKAFDFYGRIVYDKWAAVHIGTSCVRSKDNGKTWEGPYNLLPCPYEGSVAMRGNLLELKDGTLIAPLYGCKKLGIMTQTLVMASKNKGLTWNFLGEVPGKAEHHFLEPFIYEAPSGKLHLFLRTQLDFNKYPFDETYKNLFESVSEDQGKTWSDPKETKLFCPNPVNVLKKDGKLLFTYGQRIGKNGIEAVYTDTENIELDSKNKIVIRDAGKYSDLGYTSSVNLHDGSSYIVYYMTDSNEKSTIGATVLRNEK